MGIPMRVGWRPNPNSALNLVTSGLILNLDAGRSTSYPGTGTTWTDLSPTGNNGTLINGVGYSSLNSGALTFDGVNDYINGGTNPIFNFTDGTKDLPFTMSGWCYRNELGVFVLLNKGDSGSADSEAYAINFTSDNKFGVYLYDGAGAKGSTLTTNSTFTTNTWYNWCVTYDGNNGNEPNSYNYIKIYINGVLQSATGGTYGSYARMRSLNSSSPLWLGSFGNTGTYKFIQNNGKISQQLIYNRVLTATEVLQNYDATKSRFTSNISRLLDTYSGATAAYSLRKIRTEYTGNAITVRRSSDNTSQNIGFDANGNLDTTSLLSFVGAGNGFVSVWYDQSGNNKHVVQTTAASQPQLVVNGVVALKNAKPAIDFTSGQFLRCAQQGATNTAVSIFSVLSLKSLSSRGFAWDVGNTSGYQYFALDINTWGTSGNKFGLFISTNSDTDASTNLNQNLITLIAPNTSFATNLFANTRFHLNGTQKNISWGTGMGFPSYAGSSIITIGNSNAENVFFNGQQQEFILYPVNQTANRSAIETNINNYYTTY